MNDPPRINDRRKLKRDPANDSKLCGNAGHRNKAGGLCAANNIEGTTSCAKHAGIKKQLHKARGAVVMELRQWGLDHDELANPSEIMLRLLTQSAARVQLYSRYLAEATAAAERLAALGPEGTPQHDLLAAETARLDLERVFSAGPVAALIGHTYAGTQTSGVIATGERIRGLAELEAQERDRCMEFAFKAKRAEVGDHLIRMSEQMAGMTAAAMEAFATRRGLDPQDPRVRADIADALAAIAGGPPVIEGAVA